jgi:ferredoxin, 2Fe-2S
MPKVTFTNGTHSNQVCEAKAGDSILDVALANDVPLMHACGGFCACTTCCVIVKAGEAGLAEAEDEELDRLESTGQGKPAHRLGCQAKVHGDVTVEIINLDY